MKIYIDNYHPKELLKKMDKLDEYFKKQYNYIELVSPSSGIFHIENKKVYKLKAIDKPIAKLDKYYKEKHLLVDNSTYEKEQVYSQMPYDHTSNNMTTFHYCDGTDSKIYLIVEGIYENKNKNITINTTTSNLKDKYYNFIPTNFYFLTNEDLDNMLIKKELNEFLSLLI